MTINELLSEALYDDEAEFKRLILEHREELRREDGKCNWIGFAAQNGKLDLVQFLVGLGVGVNEPLTDAGNTAIYNAAMKGHAHVIRWLLDQGAEVNTIKPDGSRWCSPLNAAIVDGHLNTVKLLVERGADVNAVGPGITPLSYAVRYKQGKIADYLRSKGAKLTEELTAAEKTPKQPAESAAKDDKKPKKK